MFQYKEKSSFHDSSSINYIFVASALGQTFLIRAPSHIDTLKWIDYPINYEWIRYYAASVKIQFFPVTSLTLFWTSPLKHDFEKWLLYVGNESSHSNVHLSALTYFSHTRWRTLLGKILEVGVVIMSTTCITIKWCIKW